MSNVPLCDCIFNMKEIMKELLIIYKRRMCMYRNDIVNIRKYMIKFTKEHYIQLNITHY